MTPSQVVEQIQDANVQATVSVGAAGTSWVGWLAGVNEILVTVATIIAIVAGAWALYDKIKLKLKLRGEANDQTDPSK